MATSHAGAGSPDGPRLTEHEFRALFDRLRKATPWGPSDRRGALNYITPPLVIAALSEVKLGQPMSLASPIEDETAADNPDPCHHKMTRAGGDAPAAGLSFALDRIDMNIHGNADTHMDALCHVIYDGNLYNRTPAETVTDQGAGELSISAAADGVVGRGVLLDVPRARGVQWLEPGDQVSADDLAAAEAQEESVLGEGDLAFVRVGHRLRRAQQGPWDAATARAGIHPAAMEWLAERKIGLLASDGNNDAAPSGVQGVDFPVHVLAVAGLGLHLIDYLDFATLAPRCAELRKWSFLSVIAPLRLPNATGSPVNPIAVL